MLNASRVIFRLAGVDTASATRRSYWIVIAFPAGDNTPGTHPDTDAGYDKKAIRALRMRRSGRRPPGTWRR
jgi:hypothetical protein